MTPAEVRKFLRHARRYRDVFHTLLLTGMRKSELVHLTWHDVDLKKKQLTVRDAKKKTKVRYLPIHPDLAVILKKRKQEEGRVFYVPSTILASFDKTLRRAGIPKYGLDVHALRVTFITTLANMGVNPKTCQELAGHSNIRTTLEFYVKITNGQHVQAIHKLRY